MLLKSGQCSLVNNIEKVLKEEKNKSPNKREMFLDLNKFLVFFFLNTIYVCD